MPRYDSSTPIDGTGVPVRPIFHKATSPYDPIAAGRRCGRCGARDRWQRWTGENPGGWYCCSAPADADTHGGLDHVCTVICALGVPA